MYNSCPSPNNRRNRQFSTSEKLEAIQRVHSGESKAAVARHIDVPESTLRGWCKKEDKLRYNADKLAGNGFKQSVVTPDTASKVVTKTNQESTPRSNSEPSNFAGTFRPTPNEVNFNQNLIAQLNNQLNLAISPKSTKFPNNGFTPQSNYLTKQNSDQGLDMIYNLKRPLEATVNRSPTGDQQFFDQKSIYLAMQAMQARSFPRVSSQHQPETMMPPGMYTTPPQLSNLQRKTSSSIPLDSNGNSFLLWQKYNQSLIAMMGGEKSQSSSDNNNKNVNGHVSQPNKTQTEYSIRSLSVSSSSSSASTPSVPNRSEDIDKRRVVLDDILNNNDVTVKNDPDVIGVPEAVAYAEKFFKWFETYSDPTITSQDFMHFEKLLRKVRDIAERENKPVLSSRKIRSRK